MTTPSPIHHLHERAEALFLTYAAAEVGPAAQVVESYTDPSIEYASLRKGCLILDDVARGTIEIRGGERVAFLNNMVTQELKDFPDGTSARTFWLNKKGRIDADLRLTAIGGRVLASVDVLAAEAAATSLDMFVIMEDVEIEDVTGALHRLSLHGPSSLALLDAASETPGQATEGHLLVTDLEHLQATVVRIAGVDVIVERDDVAGEIGAHLVVPAESVEVVYEMLLKVDAAQEGTFRARPGGWSAFNIARIEAGQPVFNIDFGQKSLPGETGVLRDRVSFTKGCYLGQEVVARMDALGHPKQTIIALRAKDDAAVKDPQFQPEAGSPVRAVDADGVATGDPMGAITSSTRSPMLGDGICCFAAVKWGSHEPGTVLEITTSAGPLAMVVQEKLAFWER